MFFWQQRRHKSQVDRYNWKPDLVEYGIDEMLGRRNSSYKDIYFTLRFAIKGAGIVSDKQGKLVVYKTFFKEERY